jgi:hypothetical protein
VSGTAQGLSGSAALQFTLMPLVFNVVPAGGFGGGLEGSPFSFSYTEFAIGFYAGDNGMLVPSVTYAGETTNPGAQKQAMADYNKTGLEGVYPFTGLNAAVEAQAINSMGQVVSSYNDSHTRILWSTCFI